MAVILPTDEIRRTTILPVNLKYLAIAVGLANVVALDNNSISDAGLHSDSSSIGPIQTECDHPGRWSHRLHSYLRCQRVVTTGMTRWTSSLSTGIGTLTVKMPSE